MYNNRNYWEQIVLSALLDSKVVIDFIDSTYEDMFQDEDNRTIYKAIKENYHKRTILSCVNAARLFEDLGRQDIATYIMECLTISSIKDDITFAISRLKEEDTMVNLNHLSKNLEWMIGMGKPVEEIIDFITKSIPGVSMLTIDTLNIVKQQIDQVAENMITTREAEEDVTQLVPLGRMIIGIDNIDKATKGIAPGQLAIIAARPGQGKTALGVQTALECCSRGMNCVIMSYEMTASEIQERILLTGLGSPQAVGLNYRESIYGALEYTKKSMKGDIFILDDSTITDTKLRTILKRLRNKGLCDCLIIDYIQLMSSNKRRSENRQQELTDISNNMKALAKELDIPVLALSQFNRRAASGDGEPQLHDLRESGNLEQVADKVILMWEDEDERAEDDSYRKLIIHLAKNRQGRRVKAAATFFPDRQMMVDWR